ncbi:MAG: caspase family protein [Bacteroidia bacterium]
MIKSGEWVNDNLSISNQAKPDITWDAPVLSQIEVQQSAFRLKACIQSEGGLTGLKIFVNNTEVSPDRGWSVEDNCTRYINQEVSLRQGENVVYISATNAQGTTRSTSRTIFSKGSQPIPTPTSSARYYALLIGVNDYQDLSITDLENPINDTEKLKRVLSQHYQFESQNIYHLKNPTKRDIIGQLEILERKLTKDDYLLIFYSGHGKMQNEEGYWLPSDAQQSSSYLWLSSSELNTHVKQFASRHVLLIADACYSGAFVMRDIDDLPNASDNRTCEILENKQSRCAMTSGAKSTVPDKSVFLKYLLKELEENPYSCISAEQVYMEIKAPVISNSPNNHIPQFGDIPRTGHEGGNFIFKKR